MSRFANIYLLFTIWKGMLNMKNSYRFFENRQCEYFPCHKGVEDFNCLFCYCPLYLMEKCAGNYEYKKFNGKIIKDCSKCTFPHIPENYDKVLKSISYLK